jgi:hypothetical protein
LSLAAEPMMFFSTTQKIASIVISRFIFAIAKVHYSANLIGGLSGLGPMKQPPSCICIRKNDAI